MRPNNEEPNHKRYDVIIVGGAMYGSSIAWFLSNNSDFNGKVLVIEKDPSYEFSSTARTNSCIRQQFSAKINIQISQFGASYINNFQNYIPDMYHFYHIVDLNIYRIFCSFSFHFFLVLILQFLVYLI